MNLSIRLATKDDIPIITSFIRSVFDDAVAPTYSQEGNREFYKYIELEAVYKRLEDQHWILNAEIENEVVGIIEIRENQHVSMLFVDSNKQRKGIGRQLLESATKKIKTQNPTQRSLTVHSSPNAITAYRKLGFKIIDTEKIVKGIRFTTMKKTI